MLHREVYWHHDEVVGIARGQLQDNLLCYFVYDHGTFLVHNDVVNLFSVVRSGDVQLVLLEI